MTQIHPTARVEEDVVVGDGTKIWAHVHVRSGARIGRDCVFGNLVFVDANVEVGDCVKVQNSACLYEGVTLEDGVFVGPGVIFTNDRIPRAVTPDGRPKGSDDWTLGRTRVGRGASIGAGAVVVTGVSVGPWAMVGAGAVVTDDVPSHALVVGNPARVAGWVSAAGSRCDSWDAAMNRTAEERDLERRTPEEDAGAS